jgi:WD40 repeat protein
MYFYQASTSHSDKLSPTNLFEMKRRNFLRVLLFLVAALIVFLGYFQLFYKSKRVNASIAVFTGRHEHRHVVTSVRYSNNDSFLVSSSADSIIRIFSRGNGKIIENIHQPCGIAYMDLSPDSKLIATGGYDSRVRIYSVADGALLQTFSGHQGAVWTVAFSPDGKRVASSGDDAVIRIWDIEKGIEVKKLTGHKRTIWSVKFSPDGNYLASGSFDYSFRIWDLSNGNVIWDNKQHNETVVDLAFSHNGKILVTTSDDKTIKSWDWQNKKLLKTMSVPEHVQAIAFSPDDKWILTGGRDKPLIGEFLQTIFGNSEFNKGVSARLWNVETGELLQTFSSHSNDVQDVAYSADGNYIATASADHSVEIWKINK